jgi:signal transduction histidine kinase/ligand-binding sensor domain-containing protein/DNA-binding response OmpR family regulator
MKIPIRFYTLLALVILILSFQTFPQSHIPEKIQFKHLTREQGLSHNFIWCVLQDKKGFIWIGTYDGLNRYDGRKFKVFKHSINDTTSLGANEVSALLEDRSGNLWVGTLGGGLAKYNSDKENFTRYVNYTDSSSNANSILTLCEDSSGIIWIGTNHGGLHYFNPESNKFISFRNIPSDSTSLSHNKVYSLFEDSKGNLWIGTVGGGLNKFNRENNTFTRYYFDQHGPDNLGGNMITAISEDKSGNIWLGTYGNGLIRLVNKGNIYPPVFTYLKHDPMNPESISGNSIDFLFLDENDIMWFGTGTGGLNRTVSSLNDGIPQSFIYYDYNTNDQNSLLGNNISYCLKDNSGICWLVSWEKGINIYDTKQKPFKNYKHEPNNPFSLSDNAVKTVYEDKSGTIWIGTVNGGLNKWDRKTNRFVHYKNYLNDANTISDNYVLSIYEDSEGFLWIGTYNGGLNRFDKKKEKFYKFKNDPYNSKSISDISIAGIIEDKSRNLWISTMNFGLNLFNNKGEYFCNFNYNPDSLVVLNNSSIHQIHLIDKTDNIWISPQAGGLIVYDSQKNKTTQYKHDSNNSNSLSNNNITSVYEDESGIFWIGTKDGGLNRFDKEKGLFKNYTIKDGLPSDFINDVLEDDLGYLWISTNNGLSKFNPKSENFRNYDVEDGLLSNQIEEGCKSKTGELIFGCGNGFIIFHPDSIKDNTKIPPIYITDFYLFNKPVPIGYDSLSNRTILSKSLIDCEEIELNFDDNVFAFEFAALDYHSPNKNKYAYIMEGFDKDWTYTDASRNIATYTNLDPGEYIFRVKGSNNDGYWTEKGASIKVIILPPWWRTNLAYLIYFLLIGSIIYFIWKAQLRRLRNKHEFEMSKFEAKKLHEVDEIKSRFFTNISHEFRTPLTLILGPVKQVMERRKDEKNKDELNIAHKNANKLLGLVNQLLDISKIESGNMKLHTSPTNYIQLLKALTLSFASYAERKRITLKFNSTEDEIIVYLDRDKIEKIITNILSNAFKFTPEGGRIEVTLSKDDKYVNTIISDTGIGIPKDKVSKIFDRFYQVDGSHTREQEGTGIGLALTKELVDLHKGKIEVESEESKGTTFTVSIPFEKEHLLPEEISEIEKEHTEDKSILEPEDDIIRKEEDKIDIELFEKGTLPLLLIVEDNADVREYIKDNLTKEFRTLEAVDGEDGWNKSIENLPDLIISDVMMPKMDGSELCKNLKTDERTSHIPIILLTAKAAKEDKLGGYEIGADDYIMKPFEPDELKVRIKNLIEQRIRLHQHFQKKGIFEFEQTNITSIDKKFLQRSFDIINKHISNSTFSVEMFAEELAISRSGLQKKIQSLIGETPGDLIRRIRLNKAAVLIRQKFGNLSEIALEVGYNNPSHFSNAFKRQFGVTPSDYLQKNKTS